MRTTLLAVIAATCLILAGCGDSSTAPKRFSTLQGSWMGTHDDLTIRMVVGADTLCSVHYGYCNVSGTGTWTRTDGESGSFVFGGDYFLDGAVIALNIGGFGTESNCLFGGKFDSQTAISGTLSETGTVSTPFRAGIDGFPMTFVRQ